MFSPPAIVAGGVVFGSIARVVWAAVIGRHLCL
jgi:hypothetical protein